MPITTGPHLFTGVAVVIEDDLDVQIIICTVLRQAGFDVRTCVSGREGVAVVRDTTPTLVTVDLGLPDIDGHEVLRRIRGISDCYVLMLTARTDELDILTALQSGADDYLTKPFRPREFRARIHDLLRRPRKDESPATAAPPPSDLTSLEPAAEDAASSPMLRTAK